MHGTLVKLSQSHFSMIPFYSICSLGWFIFAFNVPTAKCFCHCCFLPCLQKIPSANIFSFVTWKSARAIAWSRSLTIIHTHTHEHWTSSRTRSNFYCRKKHRESVQWIKTEWEIKQTHKKPKRHIFYVTNWTKSAYNNNDNKNKKFAMRIRQNPNSNYFNSMFSHYTVLDASL